MFFKNLKHFIVWFYQFRIQNIISLNSILPHFPKSVHKMGNIFCELKNLGFLKFIYPEKATKFCEISTLFLSVCTVDKIRVEISQNFVAFSEYTNFENMNVLASWH